MRNSTVAASANCLRLVLLAMLAMLALGAGATAVAHTFEAPYSVETDIEGHFSYEAVFTASSTVALSALTVDGSDNTTVGQFVAVFSCETTVAAGDQWIWPVAGALADEEHNGTVVLLLEVCDGSGPFEASTTIVPNPVAADARSWTMIKACYR